MIIAVLFLRILGEDGPTRDKVVREGQILPLVWTLKKEKMHHHHTTKHQV